LAPFFFTITAAFGFVLKALIGEEELLAGGEYELRTAVHALPDPIPVLHSSTPPLEQGPSAMN
jgi:hypothetical protein